MECDTTTKTQNTDTTTKIQKNTDTTTKTQKTDTTTKTQKRLSVLGRFLGFLFNIFSQQTNIKHKEKTIQNAEKREGS